MRRKAYKSHSDEAGTDIRSWIDEQAHDSQHKNNYEYVSRRVRMKHAIIGVGAIGGLIGTSLASLGEDVTVVVRPENLPCYPKDLSLERPQGAILASAKATAKLTEPVDVLWIATKTYQLQTILETVHSLPTCAVPLLNGVDHVEILRARFGHDRVVPATIAIEAEKIAPGRFIQRNSVVRLNLAAIGQALLGAVVSRLSTLGFISQFVQNEQTLLWSKLCFLAPFALVSTASGANKGQILASTQWKQKLASANAEACAVANANGAELDPAKLLTIFDSTPLSSRSSMQKDFAAGRQLELAAFAGPIVRGGERHSIDVSTTIELVAAIRMKIAAHDERDARLPETEEFLKADLTRDQQGDLASAELDHEHGNSKRRR
jgi:2-dehydropantoate 2-reductase